MTKSTDDSSFESCLYPEESTTALNDDDTNAVITVIHDVHDDFNEDEFRIDPLIRIETEYCDWFSPDFESMLTEQNSEARDVSSCDATPDDLTTEDVTPEDALLPNEITGPRGMIEQLDMMQVEETYHNDYDISLLKQESILFSSDHQHHKPILKSSEVDLAKLCDLITKNVIASRDMDGKDILVLLGTTGSGKTSTMLYLSGVSFTQTDDGDYEIESFPSSNPEVEHYKISGSSRSCTRCLQTTTVTCNGGRKVVLCDAPGFGDTEGIEYDIANGIVMIQSLQRAKSVKPVLVFNKGWQYDRFVSLTDTLQSVVRLTGQKESLDFSTFQFVFTGYTKRDANPILKKLRGLLQEIESEDHPYHSFLMISMVNSMIHDISSLFFYVDLEDNDSSKLLSNLLNDSKPMVTNPVCFFAPFMSEKADILLNSQLQKSMSDIDKCFSNGLYFQTLSLISQVIQVCNVMQIVEQTVVEETNSQRLLHKLFECCRYHLSQVFSFTSERKDCAIAELDKFKEVNECVNLFNETAMEMKAFTNQVESHACLLLEADKVTSINWNPTEWAWKMVRLGKLSTVADAFPFLDGLSRQCKKSVDQIDDHVCQKLETISRLVQLSLEGLPDVHQKIIDINSFSTTVVESGSSTQIKYYFCEKIDFFWNNFRSRVTQLSDNFRALSDTIEQATSAKKYLTITSHTIMNAGYLRSQLISMKGTNNWSQILQNNRCYFHESVITEFDERLISWMLLSCKALELEVNSYDIRNHSDMDFAALEEGKDSILERLQDVQKVCTNAQTWKQIEQIQSHDFLNNIIKMRTNFESYVKDIDGQHKQLVEHCQKGYTLASRFLSRLRSGKDIAKLLAELDEPSSWDSWSIYDDEKKDRYFIDSVYCKVKNVLGMNAENAKLKGTLYDIVHVLKQIILYRFQSLFSVEISTSRPIEAVTYILQTRQEEIRSVVVLASLRVDSTLRKELIDKDVGRFLSRCLSFLSDSFTKISQLPQQFVAKHQFDKAGELLLIWKASNEFWRHMRSFANNPLLQDFNGGARELQNRIRDCHEYESIVHIFFNEARNIQSEVEKIGFDCDYGILHEKNKFYGQLQRFLQAVRGFEKYKNHAMTQDFESLLKIETVMLSKFSIELEQMGCHVLKQMNKFPIHSSCFKRVNSLLLNLECIDKIFKKTSPSISRQACEVKLTAEKEVDIIFAQMKETLDYESAKSIFEFLIQWKRAGYEVQSWRGLFDKNIDAILHAICQNRANKASVLMEVSLLLRSVKGTDTIIANLLLSEHNIFEGSMNAVFDERTASQDIKYVLGELTSLSESEKTMVEALYVAFETSYLSMLEEGLRLVCCDENNVDDPTNIFFKSKAEGVMNDYDLKYSHQVSQLTAILFARWSVMSNTSFFHKLKTADERRYLKKPHPAQVVGIWLMLNLLHDDFAVIKNVLVELKTGEGKSVVLGITATILSLFGLHVDCVSYSTFLSSRDYDDFKHLFECFGVLDRIRYGTITTFAEEILLGYRKNMRSVINGQAIESVSSFSTSITSRIMLIDEVDVFFGEDVLGACYLPAVSFSSKIIQDLFYTAWNSSNSLSLNYRAAIQKLLCSYPKDSRNLFARLVCNLLIEASQVKNELTSEYFAVDNEIVKKYFDGVTAHVSNAFSFRYIKFTEHGEIPKTIADEKLALSATVGRISYAELPFEYTAIIGVTGTLRGIGDSSQAILSNRYHIEKYYYVPSVFGMNRLLFSCESPKDVVISHSDADFLLELKQEILIRRLPLRRESGVIRPVMVFFRSKEALISFFDSDMMKQLKDVTNIIDETMSKEIRYGLFLKATEHGTITLMIRDFGRGTDFKCFDPNVPHEGGVHVIQAFFSIDLSEETQIKGRAARQGAQGSFSMVLNATDLCKDFSLSPDAITNLKQKGTLYTSLHELRMKKVEDAISARLIKVEMHKNIHYRTIACVDALQCGKKDEVMSFLEELNGLPAGSSFESNKKKEDRENHRELCLRMISDKDKGKRLNKLCIYNLKEKTEFEMTRVREMMKREGSNHYQVLGIPTESSQHRIQNEIRNLYKMFNPDKCHDDDAITIMQRLNTIKDELTCEELRKQYDDGLNQPDRIGIS